jgi:hypothetical protein
MKHSQQAQLENADGLNGISFIFSLEQLQDEILLTTSAVIVKLSAQGCGY